MLKIFNSTLCYPRNYLQKGKGINSVSEEDLQEAAPFLETDQTNENSKLVDV